MSNVRRENTDQIKQRYTEEVQLKLTTSRMAQRFELIVLWDGKLIIPFKMGLILILNHSFEGLATKQTVYSKEATIIGKAIRLLLYLEEVEHLFEILAPYAVGTIVITTEADPRNMNATNKWHFEVGFAKKIVEKLISLKSQNHTLFENAMASIVDERAWPRL